MSAPAPRAGLGFGGAVGLGGAAVVIIAALVIGHAVLGQLEGAARIIITFAEIMLCVLLGALTLAILGALAYGGQLARLHLAGRRAEVAGRPVMRAEVIADDAEQLEAGARVLDVQPPAIQAKAPWDGPRANVIPLSRRRGDEDA